MSRASDAVFPEANHPSPQTPDWMRVQPAAVRQVDFNDDYGNHRPQAREQRNSAAGSSPPPDPLARERDRLAELEREVQAKSDELDAQRASVEAQQEVIGDAAAAITDAVEAHRLGANQNIAEIAVSVARVLLEDAFEEAPERAKALADAALRHVEGDGITLRVGAALQISLLESGSDVAATLDTSLPPYGCIAQSSSTRVLGGLEDRLGEVLAALKEVT